MGKRRIDGVYRTRRRDCYLNYRLRNARLEIGYSQRELALMVGVSTPMISRYERLERFPSIFVRERLLKVLNKNVEELFPPRFIEYIIEIEKERKRYPEDALNYSIFFGDMDNFYKNNLTRF